MKWFVDLLNAAFPLLEYIFYAIYYFGILAVLFECLKLLMYPIAIIVFLIKKKPLPNIIKFFKPTTVLSLEEGKLDSDFANSLFSFLYAIVFFGGLMVLYKQNLCIYEEQWFEAAYTIIAFFLWLFTLWPDAYHFIMEKITLGLVKDDDDS